MLTEKQRRDYIKLAKELTYKKKYIDEIKKAKTEDEISSIMCRARHDY